MLPLLPMPRPVGRPDPDADALRCRPGVEYHELGVREILNRNKSPMLPFDWTINPYRGCEFGCPYCYARSTHSFFKSNTFKRQNGDTDWQDFESKIYVKQGAALSLRRRLKKSDLRGQRIAIGTATDPYQPAEHHYQITRSLLEVLRDFPGLNLAITTKSPMIARDLDLLTELDHEQAISVNVSMTSVNPLLARRLEPKAPDPRARLRTIEKLAAEGIHVNVFVMPILPGINDSDAHLQPLFEAARDAGAADVIGAPLFLDNVSRQQFLPWLADEFPELARRYRTLYAWRDRLQGPDKEVVMAAFRRLRLQYGFPRGHAARG